MILPEYSAILRRHRQKIAEEKECPLPDKDEQLLQEKELLLKQALFYGHKLTFVLATALGQKTVSGVPLRFDEFSSEIVVRSEAADLLKIKLSKIISLH